MLGCAAVVAAGCAAPAPAAPTGAVDVSVPGQPARTTYPLTIDNCGTPVTFNSASTTICAAVPTSSATSRAGPGDRLRVDADADEPR